MMMNKKSFCYFMMKILFFISSTNAQNEKTFVIGILSLDAKIDSTKTTYFFASYPKWLEQNNLNWIPISLYEEEEILFKKLNQINGVLFTGGSQEFYEPDGFPSLYRLLVDKIVAYAKKKNDEGVTFPLIGTCLGFQVLVQILSNEQLQVKKAANENESRSIFLTEEAYSSNLRMIFSKEELDQFSQNNLFFYHHSFGFLRTQIEESFQFRSEMRALAYNLDSDGDQILAIFEHQRYPFIGWQFHPEKTQFEHNDTYLITKTKNSIYINSKFSKLFNEFLQKQDVKISYDEIMEYKKDIIIRWKFSNNDEAFFFVNKEEL